MNLQRVVAKVKIVLIRAGSEFKLECSGLKSMKDLSQFEIGLRSLFATGFDGSMLGGIGCNYSFIGGKE